MTDATQDTRIHYLYRITNKINEKIYIGQSIDTRKRWYAHKNEARKKCPVSLISRAIKKYGAGNFEFEVIAGCKTWDDANEGETLLVSQYNSLTPNGYNVTLGGYNAPKSELWLQSMREWRGSLSEEEKQAIKNKQSQATKQQIIEQGHPALGRIVTEEEKELHRKARLEKPIEYTAELRQKMSEAHIGHTDSEETKQKKSKRAAEAWSKRINYDGIKCQAPGCMIEGKAKYKIINGARYCNKHGLRMLRYGRLNTIKF